MHIALPGEVVDDLRVVLRQILLHRGGVGDVRPSVGPVSGDDLVAFGEQVRDEVTADETGGPRDEGFHDGRFIWLAYR